MKRVFGVAAFCAVLALPALVTADGVVSGNWRLTTISEMGTAEDTHCLLHLDTKDGKTTATLVAGSPALKAPELVTFTITGDKVRIVVKSPATKVFEGQLSKDGKKITGVFGTDKSFDAAYLAPTPLTKLEAADVHTSLNIEPLSRAVQLTKTAAQKEAAAKKTKDADARVDLLKEAAEAKAKATAEVPQLCRETIARHPGTLAAGQAALMLLQRTTLKSSAEEMKSWADIASRSASEFGPRLSAEMSMQIVTSLLARKQANLAAEYALAAEKALDDSVAKDMQMKVLHAAHRTLLDGGKMPELQRVAGRLANLEKAVDQDYLTTVPSFKGKNFAGRKAQSERVVLMELFTGAQCPPCVASDVAFDVLQKSYNPKELVLLQYHLHIPGPDPMTNPDTEARWKYYRAASKNVSGTPTVVFGGKAQKSSGGAMAAAEKYYNSYCKIIDAQLEEPAGCKITVAAKRVGDKIHIHTDVAGLENPGKDLKLRLVLVEETIRYEGSNKLRYHHQVVRMMPGGANGTAVNEARMSTKNDVELGDLRQHLVSYLDNSGKQFPQLYRPMGLKNLRVIAFVQDDSTFEIVQAAQVEVAD